MITIRPATESDLQDVCRLTETVFNSSFMKDLRLKETGLKPENVRLLFEDNTLASAVHVMPRKMLLDGK